MNKIKEWFVSLWVALVNYLGYLRNLWRYRGRKFKNPLHSGKHRNCMCPCGSGKKLKNCHGRLSSLSFKDYHKCIKMMAKAQAKLSDSINTIKAMS